MNYYYDVLLNFNDDYLWNFYEWEETDPLLFVKKIPVFYVNSETIKDFCIYHVKVEEDFLNQLVNKTIYQNNQDDIYASFLLSDSKNSIGVCVDESGHVVGLSRLLLRDDNNLNEFIYTMTDTLLPYLVLEKRKNDHVFRQYEKMKKSILLEVNTLREEKNYSKLRYFYYELMHQEEVNMEVMYENMLEEIRNASYDSLLYFDYLIQLSSHQV